ncbi:MAG: methyltransferase family protein [Desulforhopalus sp.]
MNFSSSYGLWPLVVINSAIFILFAFSFTKPKTSHDWRSLGTFSAFVVAMFVEMYGFPITIYFLSGWLQSFVPETDLLAHDNGHLWYSLLGLEGNPHLNPFHLLSNLLILAGFIIVYRSWKILHGSQQTGTLATTGPYGYVRHPQYVGFILVMIGFLFMWPTLTTLIMFPILVAVYVRLAKREEEIVLEEFGSVYLGYRKKVPAFIPNLDKSGLHTSGGLS